MATYPRCVVTLDLLMEDWGADTTTAVTVAVTPRNVEIQRNDARTADTARVTLDWRDFPMDPRTVRDCRVTVKMGDIRTPAGQLTDADLAFIGHLDAPESNRGEEGSTVSLDCRDYTGQWLDTKWTGGLIDVTREFGDIVAALTKTVPGMADVTTGFSEGAYHTVISKTTGRKSFAPRKNDDTWTVLTDLCATVGLVPVFALDLLLILSPDDFGVDRATFLASNDLAPATADFVYGETDGAERLVLRRKYGSVARRQVQVLCWNETTRSATSATYPTAPVVTEKTIGTDGKVSSTTAPVLTFHVQGTYGATDLAATARSVWTEMARDEVEIEVTTHRIVPTLANGARVTVTVSPALVTDISGLSQGEALRALTTGPRALASDVAEALVAGWATAQHLAREFYCRSATHRWDEERGYTCEMTLINLLGGTSLP